MDEESRELDGNDEQLLDFYLHLGMPIPEGGGEWNLSPECKYWEFITRDFISRHYHLVPGTKVCNVGIGTGEWDDFLCFWLKGKGTLTSIDINKEIAERLQYRQARERQPNPSAVVNEDLFHSTLPAASFDLVTMIGSTAIESGTPTGAFEAAVMLVKPGGHLYLAHYVEPTYRNWVTSKVQQGLCSILARQQYDYFPDSVIDASLLIKLNRSN